MTDHAVQPYVIVKFTNENTVKAVPHSWLVTKSTCQWLIKLRKAFEMPKSLMIHGLPIPSKCIKLSYIFYSLINFVVVNLQMICDPGLTEYHFISNTNSK